ncbi:unnamed protein product [Porites evermanni]|uniref:Uncharacterized protein n=1 Tax=Porites evermanni TaxID=104178 RepID=A0ABN8PWQ1_9CNID|nr:unnamed protein product [Porites evermanni]
MKMQLEFNKKLESLITTNSIGINEQVIELKDMEQKCKNQSREVNLACDSSIHAMKIELGGEIQKLVKQISNLSTKLLAELKALKTRTKSTEDSVNHIVQQLVAKILNHKQNLMSARSPKLQQTTLTSRLSIGLQLKKS